MTATVARQSTCLVRTLRRAQLQPPADRAGTATRQQLPVAAQQRRLLVRATELAYGGMTLLMAIGTCSLELAVQAARALHRLTMERMGARLINRSARFRRRQRLRRRQQPLAVRQQLPVLALETARSHALTQAEEAIRGNTRQVTARLAVVADADATELRRLQRAMRITLE